MAAHMSPHTFVLLLFIVLSINAAAVMLMGMAFGIVGWRRSWTAAMRLTPNGKWPLARRLMCFGAVLGMLTALLYLLLSMQL
jgi:hypothetical protein